MKEENKINIESFPFEEDDFDEKIDNTHYLKVKKLYKSNIFYPSNPDPISTIGTISTHSGNMGQISTSTSTSTLTNINEYISQTHQYIRNILQNEN